MRGVHAKAPLTWVEGGFSVGELVVVPSYPMQLVMPSVVAMAVRNEMAICRIVFQVWLFIVSVWFSG